MTLANFILGERSLVAFSDTKQIRLGQDGAPASSGPASKIELLPHVPALWIVRGHAGIVGDVFRAMHVSGLGDVEALAAAAPSWLRRAHAYELDLVTRLGWSDPAKRARCIMWLGGWSAAEQRMRLVSFYSGDDFAAVDHGPGVYADPEGTEPIKVKTATLAQMIRLAEVQQDALRRQAEAKGSTDGLGFCVGGTLQAAELTVDRITIKTVHQFGDETR